MIVLFYFITTFFLTACGIERDQAKMDESHKKKRIEDESRYAAVIADLENCQINGNTESSCTTATITARKAGIPETEIESLLQRQMDRRTASNRSDESYRTPVTVSSSHACDFSMRLSSNCQTVKSAGETLPEDVDSRIKALLEKKKTESDSDEARTILIGKPITANH